MPWAAGTYTLPRDMTDDDSAGIPIVASNFDEQFEDIRDGINNTLTKDGQNVPSANLGMATFRHTNVGAAQAGTDYVRVDQSQQNFGRFVRATTSGNEYTVNLSPSVSLADGMVINFVISTTNVSTSPTLTLNSASSKELQWKDGNSITQNDLAPGAYSVVYDVSADTFKLLNYGLATIGGGGAPGLVGLATSAQMSAATVQSAFAVGAAAHNDIIKIDTSVTVTGFSATFTTDYELHKHGNMVTLDLPAVSRSDGNATTMGLASTFIPSGMRPDGTKVYPYRIQSSAGFDLGLLFVTQAGQVGFNKSVIGSAFSAGDAVKGWDNGTVTWVAQN